MADLHYAAVIRKAQSCFQERDFAQAERICENLLARNRKDLNALQLLAHCAKGVGGWDKALRLFQQCVDLQPRAVEFQLEIAGVLTMLGRHKQAIARYEKAAKLIPGDVRTVIGIAETHEKAGDREKCLQLLEPYIRRGEDNVLMAFVYARAKLAEKKPQEAVDALMRHRGAAGFPRTFFHTLGQALEQTGDIDTAFKAYATANELNATGFDPRLTADFINSLIDAFTPEAMARLPRPRHDTSGPIFIVGRPRSGTTLLEKILDAHPDVVGIGEDRMIYDISRDLQLKIGSMAPYPSCIRDLDQQDVDLLSKEYLAHVRAMGKGGKRTVNKSISNYECLGLIALLWPKAKVIDCRRNAVDNCWACYVVDLANHLYTTDLRTLGITHRYYERIMRHWREVTDLAILEVNYEDMVADQATWTRRILEFCELPWDDKTLRYYEGASEARPNAAPLTISYDQVRQPIYKTSVGRAQKFEKHLGALFEGLEIGRLQIEERDQARTAAKAPAAAAASPPPPA